MFVRKLIAALLLGIYGIPAAIGPHWHQHQHCGQACADADAAGHEVEAAGETSHCCGHSHHRFGARQAPPLATHGELSSYEPLAVDAAGLCATCQFYAAAALQAVGPSRPASADAVTMLASWHESAILSPLHAWQVRGPPATL